MQKAFLVQDQGCQHLHSQVVLLLRQLRQQHFPSRYFTSVVLKAKYIMSKYQKLTWIFGRIIGVNLQLLFFSKNEGNMFNVLLYDCAIYYTRIVF